MPALNFQARFAEDVEGGRKTQSIRETLRFKIGDTAHLFTGMRQRGCRRLGMGTVTDIADVRIELVQGESEFDGGYAVYREGKMLGWREGNAFARADGFKDAAAMCAWFHQTHGVPFRGYLISWEPVLLGDACRDFHAARSQATTRPAMSAGQPRRGRADG